MKNTAGIDVYRSDKTHVGEEYSHMNEAVKDKFDIGEYDQEGDMAKSRPSFYSCKCQESA
jgi:hypothetical protein